ncbi:hypothetical protein ACEWY4_002424 [Coilia grayii]|uniref:Uncharacterized protein n=1 Tax=Coilia grayii TaxID=363190 RepID=A0ABD1KNA6_9TELE
MHSFRVAVAIWVLCMLVTSNPAEAWYKQATSPSYYSVGRASGLLSGIRRSPYARRAETEPEGDGLGDESSDKNAVPESNFRQSVFLKTLVSVQFNMFFFVIQIKHDRNSVHTFHIPRYVA